MRKKVLPMVMSDGYMNRKQLAAYLGVSSATVLNLVKSGSLPAPIRIGERIMRWRKTEIDDFLRKSSMPVFVPQGWKTIGDE